MTPENLWLLMGGPVWLCPLHPTTYRRLIYRALLRGDEVAVLLANYRTHWQLSLDCNLPGELRNDYKNTAISAGCELGNRLEQLTRETPLVPGSNWPGEPV